MVVAATRDQIQSEDRTITYIMQTAYQQLLELHHELYPRIRNHKIDLHTRWQKSNIVAFDSAATTIQGGDTAALVYFRSREQAVQVERLMGKDGAMVNSVIETYRHPLIELRLTPQNLVVELIVSPGAWYDQQNLAGKLTIPQCYDEFREFLHDLDTDFHFGFWDGLELGDMQIELRYLLRGHSLNEWMDTFAAGYDWLRIGKWYSVDDLKLDAPETVNDIFNKLQKLHAIYEFLRWTSNNNYRSFFEKHRRR
ncbi:MAG: hypothetical protein H6672_12835 [Anaerolineaceae bacterium]|nr:hypothetical protein [Anaerolineaceae bacterium]